MRGFKTIALCAALAVFGCACSSGGAEPTPERTPSGAGERDALLTVAGAGLSRGEIVYLLNCAVDEYYMYRDIDWDGMIGGMPARRYFLEMTLERAVQTHVTGAKAEELGFLLTEAEESEIDWDITIEIDNCGGREAFLSLLGGYGLTEEQYRFYAYTTGRLREKMIDGLFGEGGRYAPDEQTVWQYYLSHYISASYIFLSGTDAYGEPMEREDWALQKSVAEALRRQAAATESFGEFFEMVAVYDQSYYMMINPEGMPIQLGMLGDAFDTALSALGEGEISPVVITDEGFYIILRLPENREWYTGNREGIWYSCAYEAFSNQVLEWGQEMGVVAEAGFWALDPLELTAMG